MVRHVVPNIMAPIIIFFSINIGGVIIAEASLSFLGFGLPVQVSELGRDAQRGRDLLDPRLIGGAGRLGAQDTRSV